MKRNTLSLDVLNDKSPWLADGFGLGNESNFSKKLQGMLKDVIASELTPLQQRVIHDYYYEGKNVTDIAKERGVNKSSVSRCLKLARHKIGIALKYGAFHLWEE